MSRRMESEVCSVDGCEKKSHARNWCITHYQRWRKYGFVGGAALWKRADGLVLDEKKCTKCLRLLPANIEYYGADRQKKDGLSSSCKECRSRWAKQELQDLRYKCINHYSNGTLACECCGESHYEFLALDHIHGNGREHRAITGVAAQMYRWIIKNNYPDDLFRVLCHNCNWSMGVRGYCPHEHEREKVNEL